MNGMRCLEGYGANRCRRKARYFGAWTGGGLCLEHALTTAREHGIQQFHAEHRADLARLTAERDTLLREVGR